tara:strand:+ start:1482 stop:2951 length:1470 start_codon:yes stop_codon:yes gene_type:complete
MVTDSETEAHVGNVVDRLHEFDSTVDAARHLQKKFPLRFTTVEQARAVIRRRVDARESAENSPLQPTAKPWGKGTDDGSPDTVRFAADEVTGKAQFVFLGSIKEAQDIETLVKAHGIDLKKYRITKVDIGGWGVTAKIKEYHVVEDDDGKPKNSFPTGQRLEKEWNGKLTVSLIEREKCYEDVMDRASKRIGEAIAKRKPKKGLLLDQNLGYHSGESDPNRMVEPAVYDIHMGKISSADETGTDWTSAMTENAALLAMHDLLSFWPSYSQIFMPFGGDFFNSDTVGGETTRGTPQLSDLTWAQEIDKGADLAISMVELALKFAPVHACVVRGNHDEQRTMFMGRILEEAFKNNKHFTIDREPQSLKSYRWGNNLIGVCHGDKEKLQKIIAEMIMKFPKDFSETLWREIHTGHGHRSINNSLSIEGYEEHEVRVRMIPSLSTQDKWHAKNLYRANRAAESYCWDKQSCYVGHTSYNLLREKQALAQLAKM